MILSELLRKLSHFDANLDVIVRGEDTIADISNVTEDFDHTDDSRFISIDLENRTEPGVEADAESRCLFCKKAAASTFNFCHYCGRNLRTA